jgi:6-phosphogluconate dehydrogenase (decarboxylating)
MEGVGKVGHRLVDHLVEAGAEVVIFDVSDVAVEAVRLATRRSRPSPMSAPWSQRDPASWRHARSAAP